MANKRTSSTQPANTKPTSPEPVSTHTGYKVALVVLVLGLVAQLVMAFIAYPRLPAQIPSGWTGSAQPYNMVPSWLVFVMFPGFELILILIALFSPKNAEGKRAMQTGNAATLIILALILTALQASAFFINRP